MSNAPKAAHEWTALPAADRKAVSAAVAAGGVVISCAVGAFYGAFFGLLSAALLFGGTASHWVPRRYSAFQDRLEVRYLFWPRPASYGWGQFRGCLRAGESFLLSRQPTDAALARLRGLRVVLPKNSDSEAEWMRRRIESSGEAEHE